MRATLSRSAFVFLLIFPTSFAALGATGDKAPEQAPAPTPAPAPAAAEQPPPAVPAAEPAHITVQHVLIGFKGSIPGKNITRSQDEAKALAYEILARAQKGEPFDALVKQYTDDAPPGIYSMSNNGVTKVSGEQARPSMVPAFGNVGFKLKVQEIGMADYDPRTSPYGWHIIKRLK